MSILAMAQPTPIAHFKRDYIWEDRQSDYASRPRSEDKIALPSIRQAFPELSLRIGPPETNARSTSSTTSPIAGLGSGAMSPSEYIHSPNNNKRRRLSIGDDSEERASQIPRLYNSSPRESLPAGRVLSPPQATRSVTDSWANSARQAPFSQQPNEGLPSMRSPPTMEIERVEPRPTLPSLPFLNFERQAAPMPLRVRGHSTDEGYRPMMMHQNGPEMEAGAPAFRHGGYPYPYHHPTRGQSLSLGSIHAFDQRTPFSAGGYGPQYQEYMRIGELGVSGDNKQRKRRGNLPKETTDKLRAWFLAHLQHPYPTEDEKQELMRQTGLQMNQISNWFINARRRQLPTMINNARAESDAMANRNSDGKVLPTTERVEYDSRKQSSVPLSDREGSAFEDDLDSLKDRRAVTMARGSV